MLKVAILIKYLSENNPQATPARLTFYNYLNHFLDPNGLFNPDDLETFFAHTLDYTHWLQNKTQLGQEIRQIIENVTEQSRGHFDFGQIQWPQDTQIIEIEHLRDFTDAVQCYLNVCYTKGEKYRLISDKEKRLIAVVLMPDQSITVQHFDRKMIIRHGQLEPLRKDLRLSYTPNLELDPDQIQKIEVSPFVTAQFRLNSEGLTGGLVRGYVCQKFFDLRGASLSSYPKLFYTIKKMEQYFIHRQTDPFYQEMTSSLERSIELVKVGDSDAIQQAMDVMARAQNALEYVFTDDKLLALLIRDLQHTLAIRRPNGPVVMTSQKAEDSWKTQRQKTNSPLKMNASSRAPSNLTRHSKIAMDLNQDPEVSGTPLLE